MTDPTPPRPSRLKTIGMGVLKYGIGLAALAYTVHKFWAPPPNVPNGAGIQNLLQMSPELGLYALCGLLFVVITVLQYLRWYLLVRGLEIPLTLRNTFRLGMVGTFYNTFLPGSVGGDAVKAFFLAKDHPGRRTKAVAAVFADRMLGLFGLILYSGAVGGACWAAGDPRLTGSPYLQKIVTVCGGLIAAAVVGWIILGLLSKHHAAVIGHKLRGLPVVGRAAEEAWLSAYLYRERPAVVYAGIGLSAVCHLCMVVLFHLVVRVFPMPDPAGLAEHFVIAPIGYIAQALFPAPGGVGGAEYIFGYLYSQIGLPEATAVVGRLALRTIEWAVGLVGFAAYLRMRAELPLGQGTVTAEEKPVAVG